MNQKAHKACGDGDYELSWKLAVNLFSDPMLPPEIKVKICQLCACLMSSKVGALMEDALNVGDRMKIMFEGGKEHPDLEAMIDECHRLSEVLIGCEDGSKDVVNIIKQGYAVASQEEGDEEGGGEEEKDGKVTNK